MAIMQAAKMMHLSSEKNLFERTYRNGGEMAKAKCQQKSYQ